MSRPATVDDADISVATAGAPREAQLKAAASAIAIICEQIGMAASVTLLWCCYEACAARFLEEQEDK